MVVKHCFVIIRFRGCFRVLYNSTGLGHKTKEMAQLWPPFQAKLIFCRVTSWMIYGTFITCTDFLISYEEGNSHYKLHCHWGTSGNNRYIRRLKSFLTFPLHCHLFHFHFISIGVNLHWHLVSLHFNFFSLFQLGLQNLTIRWLFSCFCNGEL